MEAVKLLMMVTAVNLHESMTSEEEVPVFAIIMFARDTSLDPCQFMKRHLNAVGDTGGLEQASFYGHVCAARPGLQAVSSHAV